RARSMEQRAYGLLFRDQVIETALELVGVEGRQQRHWVMDWVSMGVHAASLERAGYTVRGGYRANSGRFDRDVMATLAFSVCQPNCRRENAAVLAAEVAQHLAGLCDASRHLQRLAGKRRFLQERQ